MAKTYKLKNGKIVMDNPVEYTVAQLQSKKDNLEKLIASCNEDITEAQAEIALIDAAIAAAK